MKVKITYTVDLEEVPEQVDHLLDKVVKVLDVLPIVETLRETKSNSIEKTIRDIEIIRDGMMEADIALADSHAMLMGYLNTVTTQTSPEVKNELPPSPDVEERHGVD